MSDLIDRLVQQFKSKTQYQKFIRDSEQKFDIKTYRFQLMTQFMARKTYNQLQQKYLDNLLIINPKIWYENQRKIFVWSLLAYLKLLSDNNQEIQQIHWKQLSDCFFKKQILFLKYQYNAIQKRKKRNPWTQQQDQIIKNCQQAVSHNNWNYIAKQIFFNTKGESFKCPKQIRQRWQNHLDKNIKKQPYTKQEDLIILNYALNSGKKWAQIVDQLKNTRTQHMIKNRYKSLISKYQLKTQQKLNEQQIIHKLIQNIHNKINTGNYQQSQKNSSSNQKQQKIKQNSEINYQINQFSHKNSKYSYLQKQYNQSNDKYQVFKQQHNKIQQQPHEIRMIPKKSYYGCIERDSSGEFINQKITFPSPAPFIFQSRSPACISYNSSFLTNSYSLFNSRDLTNNTNTSDSNQQQSNFLLQSQKWSRFLSKKGIRSTHQQSESNITQKLFGIKSDSFLRLSHQYNTISQGSLKNTYLFSPTIQTLQSSSIIFNTNLNSSSSMSFNCKSNTDVNKKEKDMPMTNCLFSQFQFGLERDSQKNQNAKQKQTQSLKDIIQ